MNWFLFILGYFWLLLGIAAILFTKTIKKYYSLFITGNHPKSMGALAVLVGGLLISATVNCNYPVIVFALGTIQALKGIYLIFAPQKYVRGLINWWFNTSLIIYRLWGVFTAAMGLILLKARI